MNTHSPRKFAALSRRQSLEALRSVPVGRVVFTQNALPAVTPVNFVLDNDYIVFRTAPGSKMTAALSNAVVAFEADQVDVATHTGWSVLVLGHCAPETDPDVIAHLDTLLLDTWMPDQREHYVSIRCEQVTGRNLDGADPDPA
jgi:nitroimidazol reductase NimA-like FMN-containing flavoprotein (pyridoxamine 5'-phosphate oxidase superfamily)